MSGMFDKARDKAGEFMDQAKDRFGQGPGEHDRDGARSGREQGDDLRERAGQMMDEAKERFQR